MSENRSDDTHRMDGFAPPADRRTARFIMNVGTEIISILDTLETAEPFNSPHSL